jgi:peptidoglycan/xylan/chitin deacetylase (PgdA/CDA1 family)
MRVAVLVSGVESGKESRIARIRMTGLASGLRSREWAPAPHGESLEPGSYNARLRATDAAGNTSLSRRSPFRDERPVQAKVYSSFEGVGRRVAVTFDDCAFESAWSDILDVLRRFHVKATFFCNGTNVSRYPELARRTVAAGMGIGSHTRSHPDLRTVSSSEIVAQVRYDEDIWWQVARITPAPYFRPPYGAYDQHVLDAVGRVGFARTMLWDVDPQDWRRPGASEVARRILSHAHPGMVTLLHVIPESVAAVPLVLRGLERRGLHQVSLDEMLHAAGP